MQFLAAGINHHSAPVDLRERFAIPTERLPEHLQEVAKAAGLREAMLLSTCNRVELYGVCDDPGRSGGVIFDHLGAGHGVPRKTLEEATFVRVGESAVRHIFRVAASLDSLVVGEPQVLGQVKEAWELARWAGAAGAVLDRCLTVALHAAKRVRTETGLAQGAASVSSVAVELARSIFGDLSGRGVLIIGAGEMAQQAGIHLRSAGASEIVVVNRSAERGEALARELDGRYEPWDHLEPELVRADVVVTSTGAVVPVLGRRTLRPVMRKRRYAPLFLVDIAVPRDVDPDAARLDHVFLYNIDDLQNIVHDNRRARMAEAERAEVIVDEEVANFLQWMRLRAVGPLIGRLQAHSRAVARGEVERALRRLPDLDPRAREVVERLGHDIVGKLLHTPITRLRDAAKEPGPAGAVLTDAVRELFEIDATSGATGGAVEPEAEAPADGKVPEPS